MYQNIKKSVAEILACRPVLISKGMYLVLEVTIYLGVVSVLLGLTYLYVCSPCPVTYFDECA